MSDCSPFIKLECGCILLDIGHPKTGVCVYRCDRDYDDNRYELWFGRDFQDSKTCTPLTEAETLKLVKELGDLIADGYAMQTVRHLINWPVDHRLTDLERKQQPKENANEHTTQNSPV
jgi:hypothetical protein